MFSNISYCNGLTTISALDTDYISIAYFVYWDRGFVDTHFYRDNEEVKWGRSECF